MQLQLAKDVTILPGDNNVDSNLFARWPLFIIMSRLRPKLEKDVWVGKSSKKKSKTQPHAPGEYEHQQYDSGEHVIILTLHWCGVYKNLIQALTNISYVLPILPPYAFSVDLNPGLQEPWALKWFASHQ